MSFHARFSSDEGKTWSGDSLVTTKRGYQAVNNARVIQLRDSSRLLAPVFFCRGKSWKDDYYFYGVVYYSDDNGRTWRDGGQRIDVKACSYGFDEPAVIELKDGRVMMLIRTDTGRIWRCYSRDGGVTWSEPAATDLASPSSPATIRRIPSTGDLLLVWNNVTPRPRNRGQPRNPLTAAISSDEGETWKRVRNVEDSEGGNYCYSSVTFNGRDVILSYYERGALKVCVAEVDWFYR
jgi:predicted neuraminidase